MSIKEFGICEDYYGWGLVWFFCFGGGSYIVGDGVFYGL